MDIGKQQRIIQIEPEPLSVPVEPEPNTEPTPVDATTPEPATND